MSRIQSIVIVRTGLWILLAAGVSGCSSGSAPIKGQLPTFPVKGVVQIDGKPAGPANLQLRSSDRTFPVVAASVADDGRFTLMTYRADDGAPKGKFTATLMPVSNDPSTAISEVEPLAVEITKAESHLSLDFKGTGKPMVHPLSIRPPNPISTSDPLNPNNPLNTANPLNPGNPVRP